MPALSSNSGEWQTPPWLVEMCRTALGGTIALDPATTADNPTRAERFFTKEDDALTLEWEGPGGLFLNPPGDRTGRLIRRFWQHWNQSTRNFTASVWVDFNLDHLRFICLHRGDTLLIPRKRLAFVDPATGKERKGAPIGGFLLFRGLYGIGHFPAPDFLELEQG